MEFAQKKKKTLLWKILLNRQSAREFWFKFCGCVLAIKLITCTITTIEKDDWHVIIGSIFLFYNVMENLQTLILLCTTFKNQIKSLFVEI